jgi:hypothetical protein
MKTFYFLLSILIIIPINIQGGKLLLDTNTNKQLTLEAAPLSSEFESLIRGIYGHYNMSNETKNISFFLSHDLHMLPASTIESINHDLVAFLHIKEQGSMVLVGSMVSQKNDPCIVLSPCLAKLLLSYKALDNGHYLINANAVFDLIRAAYHGNLKTQDTEEDNRKVDICALRTMKVEDLKILKQSFSKSDCKRSISYKNLLELTNNELLLRGVDTELTQ